MSKMGRAMGKVALVTGAARNQGEAFGTILAREGAQVCFTDILVEQGQAVVDRLKREGLDVIFERLDVTSEEEWQKVVEKVVDKYGKIDILVNNAGVFHMEGIEATTKQLWDKVIAVNQTGVFYGMKTVVPYMKQQKSGSIINISSTAGLTGIGGAIAYQATKGAIRIMSKSAATEYAQYSVRVNSIHPGLVDTEMLDILKDNKGTLESFIAMTPLGRMGTVQDIGNLVLYLASDESCYMTGSELVIDGGLNAQ